MVDLMAVYLVIGIVGHLVHKSAGHSAEQTVFCLVIWRVAR